MKRWALLVVLLYGAALFVLAGPVVFAAFWPDSGSTQFLKLWAFLNPQIWPLWAWIGLMMLAEAALLVVPIRIAAGRPVRRRHVFWTVLATVAAGLLMLAAMVLAAVEHLDNTPAVRDSGEGATGVYLVFGLIGVLWLAWAILFALYGSRRNNGLMPRVVRFLLAGSIMELLVAVPTHTIARMRGYCCAGYLTFWGLATGVSVLLFAFGPGVLLLFARRWRDIRPPNHGSRDRSSSSTE